jgi:hypothetical protein
MNRVSTESQPLGITRPQWHELCDQLIELETAGALGGIRAIVAERLARVRSGLEYEDPAGAAAVTISWIPVSSEPGSPRHRQLLAAAAAHLAAVVDQGLDLASRPPAWLTTRREHLEGILVASAGQDAPDKAQLRAEYRMTCAEIRRRARTGMS